MYNSLIIHTTTVLSLSRIFCLKKELIMKHLSLTTILFIIMALLSFNKLSAQTPENWTSKQLMQPAELAEKITAGKDVPVLISVGPGATIPKSIDIGMVKDKENLDKLKKELQALPSDTKIVVYCKFRQN
ncbi:MAG: hypothetical protein NVSMB67_31070 [Flavisolibacter sp.]